MHGLPPLTSADSSRPDVQPLDHLKCIPTLKEKLPLDLGTIRASKRKAACVIHAADWDVATEFWLEMRGGHGNLFCEHQLDRDVVKGLPGETPISFRKNLLITYGLYSSTMARIASEPEREPAIVALIRLSRHFVLNLLPLLNGLGIHDE
jgi:hypothetical protein